MIYLIKFYTKTLLFSYKIYINKSFRSLYRIYQCNHEIVEEDSSENESSESGTAYLSSISSGSLEIFKDHL